jgi:hypothetical protein
MQVLYMASEDALSVILAPADRPVSREIAPGVTGDFDQSGRLVALEILDASKRYPDADFTTLPDGEEWLTLEEASAAAAEEGEALAPSTMRVQLKAGRLTGRKQGRDWLISRAALWNYLESRAPSGRPSPNAPKDRQRHVRILSEGQVVSRVYDVLRREIGPGRVIDTSRLSAWPERLRLNDPEDVKRFGLRWTGAHFEERSPQRPVNTTGAKGGRR